MLVRVQELLFREGVQASYTTLRRFVEHKPGHRWREATVRLPAPPPGEEAQVDFGLVGWIPDEAGRLHKLHVLAVTLSFSVCFDFMGAHRSPLPESRRKRRLGGGLPQRCAHPTAPYAIPRSSKAGSERGVHL